LEAVREEERFRREQGDFDALFRAHYPEIVRYLSARLGSREAASDLASDVFVEAFRRVPLLRWRGRPVLAWLYRVADPTETFPEREALAKALAGLSADHQLVVHLRLVEGYSFSETARLMGRSVGACQMLLLRAGKLLREELEKEGVRAGVS